VKTEKVAKPSTADKVELTQIWNSENNKIDSQESKMKKKSKYWLW
jgi:hypothetical protein